MLTGIHFLLTYKCIYECDHCFVYSSPGAEGTFTLEHIDKVLDEAEKIGTIEWIYFEGGEPFLYYPLLIEGIKSASRKGFKTGIVTNAYFATSLKDTIKWLLPFHQLGVSDISISNDLYHGNNKSNNHAIAAYNTARKWG
jgi:MoaA/NifB/PqqE/SkfB family radical SAM enzyme